MKTRRPEPHTLAGAYTLDALTRADRARFERHLARPSQLDQLLAGQSKTFGEVRRRHFARTQHVAGVQLDLAQA